MSISNQLCTPVPASISPLPKSPSGPAMQHTVNLPKTSEEQGIEEIVTQSAVKNNEWTPLISVDNSEDHESLYDGLHLDPRFFSLGAPSSVSKEMGAKILYDLKESAIQQRRRDVTFFFTRTGPSKKNRKCHSSRWNHLQASILMVQSNNGVKKCINPNREPRKHIPN